MITIDFPWLEDAFQRLAADPARQEEAQHAVANRELLLDYDDAAPILLTHHECRQVISSTSARSSKSTKAVAASKASASSTARRSRRPMNTRSRSATKFS